MITHTVKPDFFVEKKCAGHGNPDSYREEGWVAVNDEMLEHHRGRLRLENSNRDLINNPIVSKIAIIRLRRLMFLHFSGVRGHSFCLESFAPLFCSIRKVE